MKSDRCDARFIPVPLLLLLSLLEPSFADVKHVIISPDNVLTIGATWKHPGTFESCNIEHVNSQRSCKVTIPEWLVRMGSRYTASAGDQDCKGFLRVIVKTSRRTVKEGSRDIDVCDFKFERVTPKYEGLWITTFLSKEGYRKMDVFNATRAGNVPHQ